MPRPPSDRPERIAEAALDIIATSGLHAVTHRTIDARLGFPAGTTSYYARTRAELLGRGLSLLVDRFDAAMTDFPLELASTDEEAIRLITGVAMLLESQERDQIARFVLLIDLRHDEALHPQINVTSAAQQKVHGIATALVEQFGVPDAAVHASNLLALIDGLMFARLASDNPLSIEKAVATYWAGMPRA